MSLQWKIRSIMMSLNIRKFSCFNEQLTAEDQSLCINYLSSFWGIFLQNCMKIIKHITLESQMFDFPVLTVNASYNLNDLSVPNVLILINVLQQVNYM